MSKSFEWAMKRVKKTAWSDRQWENAKEIDVRQFIPALKTTNTWNILGTKENGEKIETRIIVDISPDMEEFDYYTSSSLIHDGTLLFETEVYSNVVNNIITGRTYNGKKYKGIQNNDTIHYIIGNIVGLNEFDGDWIPEDKKWMSERTSALIPVLMEIT